MKPDEEFVEEYRPLVASIAHKVRAQFDLDCELDDLLAYGFAGLLEAQGRFDASRGVQFNTFAYYRIRGAMIDGVRKAGFMNPRAYAKMKAARAALEIGESVADSRAADPHSRGDKKKAIAAVHETLGKLTASFALASVGQPEDQATHKTAEDALLRGESAIRLRDAIAQLPEREMALVQGFYFEDRQFDEVAKELGISKSWASRLHAKALKLLREALES